MYYPGDSIHASSKGAKAPTTLKMGAKPQKRSPSPDLTLGRASFSSVRERASDFTQTFTTSKVSSYDSGLQQDEVAVVDEPITPISEPSGVVDAPTDDNATMLLSAALHDVPVPRWPEDADVSVVRDALDRSLAWLSSTSQDAVFYQDSMKGQDSSLTSGRARVDGSQANVDDADTFMEDMEGNVPVVAKQPLERLPLEIYRLIVDHLISDAPPNGIDRRNVDLMSLLVTSRALYGKTLEALYRRVTVPHSRIFQKYLAQIEADNFRGTWVRRLDFSHFNPVSLFSTASERAAARNLTAETLLRCLNLTPNLQEFLVQDYLDSDIDETVLQKLFTGLPSLKALDLCGCSSVSFRNAFTSLVTTPTAASWPQYLGIQRLSLHKCISLPSSVFEFLLPKLNRATHLDLAGTRVTDAALHNIPKTARITHLNLAKCSLLTAEGVIDFLTNHPAVNQNSLVFLSLGFEAATSQLLDSNDVTRLLPILPQSLKSLSLKGSKMDHSHVPQLRSLSKNLEELALGRGLTLGDVNALVVPPTMQSGTAKAEQWVPHTLRYLDLTDMNAESFDVSSFYLDTQLLDPATAPLEVIEVTDDIFKRVSKARSPLQRMGWRQSEIGARSWLVRGSHPAGKAATSISGSFAMENGQRPWKMGAQSWGMRKIPVAHAKVGGMYGSYMFGRKL